MVELQRLARYRRRRSPTVIHRPGYAEVSGVVVFCGREPVDFQGAIVAIRDGYVTARPEAECGMPRSRSCQEFLQWALRFSPSPDS
jgi:hypothetical protein